MPRTKKQPKAADLPATITTTPAKPKRVRPSRSKTAIAERALAKAQATGDWDNVSDATLAAAGPYAGMTAAQAEREIAEINAHLDDLDTEIAEAVAALEAGNAPDDAEERAMARLDTDFGTTVGLPLTGAMGIVHDVVDIVVVAGIWFPPKDQHDKTLDAAAICCWDDIKQGLLDRLTEPKAIALDTYDIAVEQYDTVLKHEAEIKTLKISLEAAVTRAKTAESNITFANATVEKRTNGSPISSACLLPAIPRSSG